MITRACALLLISLFASQAAAQWPWEAGGFQQPARSYNQVNTCPAGGKAGTLRVTGSNEQSAQADQAVLMLTVSVLKANSSTEAGNTTMDAAGRVIKALTSEPNAVDQNDINTESISVSSSTNQYQYGPQPSNNTATYSYVMQLSVKLSNVTRDVLANTLNTILSAGGSAVNINRIQFSLSEHTRNALKRKAQGLAVRQAKEKARRLAKDLDVTISHIVSVQDDPSRRFLSRDDNKENKDPVKGKPGQPGGPRGGPQGERPPEPGRDSKGVAVGTEYVKSTMRITYGICNPNMYNDASEGERRSAQPPSSP